MKFSMFLILAISGNGIFLQVTARQDCNFCARLSATDEQFRIVRSNKEWGKWIAAPNDVWNEVAAPNGKTFGPNNAIYVCSAGRENLVSGTNAEITIQPLSSHDRITIKWDSPPSGESTHDLIYDSSKYLIEETYVHTNFFEYVIRKK